jgi:hypothetical protein
MEDTRARRAMAVPRDIADLAGLLARLLTEGKPSKEITLSNGDIGIPEAEVLVRFWGESWLNAVRKRWRSCPGCIHEHPA